MIWSKMESLLQWNVMTSGLPLVLAVSFFTLLFQVLAHYPTIFLKRHGRKHALTGFCYLMWICLGFVDLILAKAQSAENSIKLNSSSTPLVPYLLYDIILGILGTYLTLFAAWEFQHKHVKNMASGTLDEHATVTYGEMMEHSFYQILNLLQIIFIHSMTYITHHTNDERHQIYDQNTLFSSKILQKDLFWRLLALLAVTFWWYFRPYYPINKFSDNYQQVDDKSTTLIRILYRIKKYQYVFYKHFLLHGLNMSIALTGLSFGEDPRFRLYWLLLNTSYVMEFFLQTLVKKSFMSQSQMLALQKILMLASTIAAVMVLQYVNVYLAMLSLVANFVHRKHDIINTVVIVLGYVGLVWYVLPEYLV